ncbi:MAG: peptidase S41, partial [Rhodospirillaceae bacterium]|nr:peptidase S41 [Rhodospirillaceae bacterium]
PTAPPAAAPAAPSTSPPLGTPGRPQSQAPAAPGQAPAGEQRTQDTEDYQLARALDLLQGIAIYQKAGVN